MMAEAGPVGGQCCVPNWARSPHQFHVADASPHSRRCHHLLHHIQHSTFSTSYCTDPSSGEGKTKQSKHVLNMVFGNIIYYILYTINCILNTIYYILYIILYMCGCGMHWIPYNYENQCRRDTRIYGTPCPRFP